MKLLAFLLISISLCVGLLAASTAYAPSIDRDDLVGLTLSAPAGAAIVPDALMLEAARSRADGAPATPDPDSAHDRRVLERLVALGPDALADARLDEDGVVETAARTRVALYPPGTVIDAATLEILRANRDALGAGGDVVRVREFGLARWSHFWVLGLSVLGLLAGAGIIRAGRRSAAADAAAAVGPAEGPEAALAAVHEGLVALKRDLAGMPAPEERLHSILHRIERLQRTHIEAFVEGRDRLASRIGLAGAARVLDRFAAAERVVNRAWSAAADRVLEEAEICVDDAVARIELAVSQLERESATTA